MDIPGEAARQRDEGAGTVPAKSQGATLPSVTRVPPAADSAPPLAVMACTHTTAAASSIGGVTTTGSS